MASKLWGAAMLLFSGGTVLAAAVVAFVMVLIWVTVPADAPPPELILYATQATSPDIALLPTLIPTVNTTNIEIKVTKTAAPAETPEPVVQPQSGGGSPQNDVESPHTNPLTDASPVVVETVPPVIIPSSAPATNAPPVGFVAEATITPRYGELPETSEPTLPVPAAYNDQITTQEDIPTDINVLANDTGLDTVTTFTQPLNGTVSQNADGTLHYVPAPGFSGEDSFSYSASTGVQILTAEVSITVDPFRLIAPVTYSNCSESLTRDALRITGISPYRVLSGRVIVESVTGPNSRELIQIYDVRYAGPTDWLLVISYPPVSEQPIIGEGSANPLTEIHVDVQISVLDTQGNPVYNPDGSPKILGPGQDWDVFCLLNMPTTRIPPTPTLTGTPVSIIPTSTHHPTITPTSTASPSATPTDTLTLPPSATPTDTPDCAPGTIWIRFSRFEYFGIVRLEVINNQYVPIDWTDFEIIWRQWAPAITLRLVTAVAPIGQPGSVMVWESSGDTEDAIPPTHGQGEGIWQTDFAFDARSVIPIYLDFDGLATSLAAIGAHPSDLNGMWLELGCNGVSRRITLDTIPTPTPTIPTATKTPTMTPYVSLTPTRTPIPPTFTRTPIPPTRTPPPPSVTLPPSLTPLPPTETQPPSPTPTETPATLATYTLTPPLYPTEATQDPGAGG
ncbi:MAG: cadherin-like domain-containing protein [Anaerolineae bacterium]|nr:cadherin-like domain-containing protein [Anaerolineae bacterium]